jgi:hypothetical protein
LTREERWPFLSSLPQLPPAGYVVCPRIFVIILASSHSIRRWSMVLREPENKDQKIRTRKFPNPLFALTCSYRFSDEIPLRNTSLAFGHSKRRRKRLILFTCSLRPISWMEHVLHSIQPWSASFTESSHNRDTRSSSNRRRSSSHRSWGKIQKCGPR